MFTRWLGFRFVARPRLALAALLVPFLLNVAAAWAQVQREKTAPPETVRKFALCVMDSNGRNLQVVWATDKPIGVAGTGWSGDNFVYSDGKDIYLVHIPTKRHVKVPLPNPRNPDETSPDIKGERLVYMVRSEGDDGKFGVCTNNLQGTDQKDVILPANLWPNKVAWSRKTGRIIFSALRDNDGDGRYSEGDIVGIYKINESGGNLDKVASEDVDGTASWIIYGPEQHSSGKILYRRSIGGNQPRGHIYMMDSDGSGKTEVTGGMNQRITGVAWIDGGDRIAYSSFDLAAAVPTDIHSRKPSGGEYIKLTDNPEVELGLASSSDGKKIAFFSMRDVPKQEVTRMLDAVYVGPLGQTGSQKGGKAISAKTAWEITPNAELRGINGRLVTTFADRIASSSRMVYVYTPGTAEQVSMVVVGEPQLVPEGEYDVKVQYVVVPNVPIKKGHDTRILIGGVTFPGGGDQVKYIYDETGTKQLIQMLASDVIAVPVGTYSIKAGSRVIKFEVKDGEITEL